MDTVKQWKETVGQIGQVCPEARSGGGFQRKHWGKPLAGWVPGRRGTCRAQCGVQGCHLVSRPTRRPQEDAPHSRTSLQPWSALSISSLVRRLSFQPSTPKPSPPRSAPNPSSRLLSAPSTGPEPGAGPAAAHSRVMPSSPHCPRLPLQLLLQDPNSTASRGLVSFKLAVFPHRKSPSPQSFQKSQPFVPRPPSLGPWPQAIVAKLRYRGQDARFWRALWGVRCVARSGLGPHWPLISLLVMCLLKGKGTEQTWPLWESTNSCLCDRRTGSIGGGGNSQRTDVVPEFLGSGPQESWPKVPANSELPGVSGHPSGHLCFLGVLLAHQAASLGAGPVLFVSCPSI